MEELTKKIKRDLFDIKENINNPDKLMELFSFNKEEFEDIIHNLKFSVEDSLFEFKNTAINLILDPLNSLQYDSRAMNSFDDQIIRARGLLTVTLIQRLIAVSAIKIAENKGEGSKEALEKEVSQPGIKEILDFVQKEPKTNPGILKDTLFKKIIMHIKMYRNESQKMNELMTKVSAEKKIAIKRNFNITLTDQVAKMRDAYNEIIDRTVKKEQAPVTQNLLLRYDFKTMGKFYMIQIEAFSKLLSTLTFAKDEKFNTRELLLNLTKEKGYFSSLIEKERTEYSSIVLFDEGGIETGKAF
ncbi:MAG: hypothetical protein KAQ93_07790, partial [Spirochaetales bacterium]|nr:hypothetical protein [Spirochaetales bacterium]